MNMGKKMFRWVAVVAAIVLLAAACGDDGGSSDTTPPDDTSSADASSNDPPSDDTSTDETSSDDASTSDETASDEPSDDDDMQDDAPPDATTLDCAEIQAAVEAAGDFTQVDPTGTSGSENLEESFNQSRAALAALGESAPEIAGEVEQAIEGLDALGAIFAELNWNTDFSSNPDAAMELVGAMGNSDIVGMIGAMQAISTWIATSCTP